MFSSNKKGKDSKKRSAKPNDNVMNMFGVGMEDEGDEDDESLEAELAALQGRPVHKKKSPKKGEKLMSVDEISKLAAHSMRDIDDDDISDDDVDEDDLLAELNDLMPDEDTEPEKVQAKSQSPPKNSSQESGIASVLSERRSMYVTAFKTAQADGASSKMRRLERGIKELDKLLKDARSGKTVKEDDIPPPVAVPSSRQPGAPEPQQQLVEEPSSDLINLEPEVTKQEIQEPLKDKTLTEKKAESPQKPADNKDEDSLKMLTSRRDQYKMAALAKKREGDIQSAKHLFGISKQFDPVISALESGQPVDLSRLPPPPSEVQATKPVIAVAQAAVAAPAAAQVQKDAATPPQVTGDPSAPTSIAEALQQRYEKYQQSANQAKDEGNDSKSRRMARIAKQYQDSIRDYKRGKTVDFEELPTPPGYAPIPVPGGAPQGDAASGQPAASEPAPAINIQPPQAAQAQQHQPQVEVNAGSSQSMSRNEKELQFILTRQKEFKMAALQAKKNGDMEAAKSYLKQAMGMNEMVVAAQSGLRVDITTVPSLKQKEKKTSESRDDEFTHVQSVAVSGDPTALSGDASQVYARLETALKKQMKTSKENADHYRLLGDLSAAKNFDTLHRGSQQDLDTLIMSRSHGETVPKFHYEMKSFPIVRSHPELSDSELEINIVRCINVPLPSGYQPKDMYTYITYEFSFPSETPQTGSTNVVKSSINPEFDQSFRVKIDRKSRALPRIFRRQPLNFKIMYQRGFLKSDKALGQANIKLEHFNNKSTVHECVELVDLERGRKAVGGKLEVMLKIREPLVDKDVEVVNEKWLVLDSHLRTLQIESSAITKSPSMPRASTTQYKSLEVAKFDKEVTEKQIAAYKAQGKSAPAVLLQKLEDSQDKIREIQAILKQGGNPALAYMKQLKPGIEVEKAKAQQFLQSGDRTEAKMCLARKKLIEKEVAATASS